jgi:peptide/nickel transport system substrate-binding protein
MNKRTVWLVVSGLMVLALVLASCGPAVTEEEEEEKVVTEEEEEAVAEEEEEEEVVVVIEQPKYGGVLNLPLTVDIRGFDEAVTVPHYSAYTLWLTNEELLMGDWAKGPAGTHQADLILGGINRMELKTGALAESWEVPEGGTLILHIRKGVHYALNPQSEASRLVNGRELTADDVVFSLKRYLELKTSYIGFSYPGLAASAEITAPDESTVMIKVPPEEWANAVTLFPDFATIFPPEVVQNYGDMTDWRNSVGTGPFILVDFLSMSSATLIRNHNYWGKDPVGPGKGNQLPYLDGVNYLIIPDRSTRIAALRTGKLDRLTVDWEDAAAITRTNPELLYRTNIADSSYSIYMRIDKPETPFADIRVRRALHLALNQQEIVDEFYGGQAEILVWPIIQTREYADAYVPLEELPESVQELYGYNPDKAKQLLAEAGYPDGFKTTVVCYATETHTDYLSVVKAYWEQIGVELVIDAKEYVSYVTLAGRRNYEQMMYYANSGIGTYMKMINMRGPGRFNQGYIDDPVIEETYQEMVKHDIATGEAVIAGLNRELMPYLLDQAYVITKPNPYSYTFWQPWLKNYRGEGAVGYYNGYKFAIWVSIDQDLKEEMTGRR